VSARSWRAVGIGLALLALSMSCTPAPPEVTYTYSISTIGPVTTPVSDFAAEAARIYRDGRGWAQFGKVALKQVDSGGDFTLWLATPDKLPTFSPVCDETWNCTVGNDVIVNEARWKDGSPTDLPLSLPDYRALIINHETGHWLGLQHRPCPAPGALAPVMMQQSISLGGCRANPWPTPAEISAVNQLHHLARIANARTAE
jgi:hypothetical protein